MLSSGNYYLADVEIKRHHEEATSDASQRHVLRAMKEGASRPQRYQRWLAALGSILVAVGCFLQARYDRVAKPPVSLGKA